MVVTPLAGFVSDQVLWLDPNRIRVMNIGGSVNNVLLPLDVPR